MSQKFGGSPSFPCYVFSSWPQISSKGVTSFMDDLQDPQLSCRCSIKSFSIKKIVNFLLKGSIKSYLLSDFCMIFSLNQNWYQKTNFFTDQAKYQGLGTLVINLQTLRYVSYVTLNFHQITTLKPNFVVKFQKFQIYFQNLSLCIYLALQNSFLI